MDVEGFEVDIEVGNVVLFLTVEEEVVIGTVTLCAT